jgi:hypothetical protein
VKKLKEELNEDLPVGPLIRKCCTLDQVGLCTFQLFTICCGQPNWFFDVVHVSEYICSLLIGKSCHNIPGCNSGQDTSWYCCHFCCTWPWEISCSWFINCWSYCCGVLGFSHKYLYAWWIHRLCLGPHFKIIWCRYSNIFVTAPSPENLRTLFEFICKGLVALDYEVLVLSLVDSYYH